MKKLNYDINGNGFSYAEGDISESADTNLLNESAQTEMPVVPVSTSEKIGIVVAPAEDTSKASKMLVVIAIIGAAYIVHKMYKHSK